MAHGPGWRIAIDRGGTFTDVVAWDPAGRLHFCKVLSQDSRDATDPAVRSAMFGGSRPLPSHGLLGDETERALIASAMATVVSPCLAALLSG